MSNRNYLFLRSIGVGAFSKIFGALVVFIGIPLVALKLGAQDYKTFLVAMSAGSFSTLALGALGLPTIRALSAADNVSKEAFSEEAAYAVGAYLLVGIGISTFSVILYLVSRDNMAIFLATVFSILRGVLQFGDSIRVARREDHITSLIQCLGSLILLLLIVVPSKLDLMSVIFIYFGSPCLVYATVALDLYARTDLRFRVKLNVMHVLKSSRSPIPFLFNSFTEYLKIFGAGLLLSTLVPPEVYTRFQTAVIMMARLITPLSLVTRPMLPAYINALHTKDYKWLKGVARMALLAYVAYGLAIFLANLAFPLFMPLMPKAILNINPDAIERVFLSVFLLGQTFVALSLPIFVARKEMGLFLSLNFGISFVCVGTGYVLSHVEPVAMFACLGASTFVTSGILLRRLGRTAAVSTVDASEGQADGEGVEAGHAPLEPVRESISMAGEAGLRLDQGAAPCFDPGSTPPGTLFPGGST